MFRLGVILIHLSDKIHRKTNVFPISSITMRGYVFRCGEWKDPRYTEWKIKLNPGCASLIAWRIWISSLSKNRHNVKAELEHVEEKKNNGIFFHKIAGSLFTRRLVSQQQLNLEWVDLFVKRIDLLLFLFQIYFVTCDNWNWK